MKNEASLSREAKCSIPRAILLKRYDYFAGFLIKSALVGIAAGLVGVAFRLTLTEGEMWRNNFLIWAHGIPEWGWLLLPCLGVIAGGLASWLTSYAPETAGSGIPHVEAVLSRQRKLVWWRVIPVKFIAGALAIGAGLSLGREGPTVQMGSAAAQVVSKSFSRSKTEELQLIACGAGAGLAAAFNAPLAGVVFVLEEMRRNFSPYVLGGSLAASITADLITQRILGPLPTFKVANLLALPNEALPLLIVLGILTGVLGAAFNYTLVRSLDIVEKFPKLPAWLRVALITSAAGLIGYFLPGVLGGGHGLVEDILTGRIWLAVIPIVFAVKFLLTMASYSAGVPGGIFLPLLVLGALQGSLIGQGSSLLFPAFQGMAPSFAVVGMAAYFTAIVRAPITGVILVAEMTGSFQQMMLPILIASIIAYIVAEALGSLPVYEMLLERDLAKDAKDKDKNGLTSPQADKMHLVEFVVEGRSKACGCRVKDLALPPDCLLVTVNRGSGEIIPRGNTKLLEGDLLTVVVPESRAAAIIEECSKITCCKLSK